MTYTLAELQFLDTPKRMTFGQLRCLRCGRTGGGDCLPNVANGYTAHAYLASALDDTAGIGMPDWDPLQVVVPSYLRRGKE